ncbi:MAG: hypothetical protein R3E66_03530, partial [bacterium]
PVLSCAFFLVAGCGASSTQSTPSNPGDPTEAATGDNAVAAVEMAEGNSAGALPPGSKSALSYINFTNDGLLQLGTHDGKIALVNVMARKAQAHTPAAGYRIEAVSPDGTYTVINSSPARVVSTDGTLILNMNMISSVAAVRFAPDVFSMFVTEPSGKLRVWGQAHSFEKQGSDETLAQYLNRQGSDFTVEFEPLSGPIFALPDNALLMAGADGVVSFWSSNAPSKTRRVMKLDGPLKQLTASGTDIVAVSVSGSLKVGKLDPPSYQPWSREARTEWAATNSLMRGEFVEVVDGTLKLRETETGNTLWEKPLPAGASCGVAVSADSRLGAACVGDVIMVFNTRDGKWDSMAWFGDDFHWTGPNGAKIY